MQKIFNLIYLPESLHRHEKQQQHELALSCTTDPMPRVCCALVDSIFVNSSLKK
jgi:hypothetical protein